MNLYKDDERPLYIQAADAIRTRMADGHIRQGDRLPSVRRLSDELGVNPATIVSAYRILREEGLVTMRQGSGVYASYMPEAEPAQVSIPPESIRYNLAANEPPPDSYPLLEFKHYIGKAIDIEGANVFTYQEASGYQPLRESAARELGRSLGRDISPEDIHIVSGAQQGLDLASRILLRQGDLALVENPGYQGAAPSLISMGARVEPIQAGAEGIDLARLRQVAERRPLRAVYLNPTLQNPSQAVYPQAFRTEILELAEEYGFYIIEDDLFGDIADNPPPPIAAADRNGRVIYIKSFSKTLMPGLRIAFLAAPSSMRDRLEAGKRSIDLSSNGLMQRALHYFIDDGGYKRHLGSMRLRYKKAFSLFEKGLAPGRGKGFAWEEPAGGFNLWLALPVGTSGRRAARLALGAGILVAAESEFSIQPKSEDSHLRLSFGYLPFTDIEESAKALLKSILLKE